MELIYFILGFLFTVTSYGIVMLYKTKTSHNTLLEEIEQYKDLTHTFTNSMHTELITISDKMEEITRNYYAIQEKLKTDTYEGNNKLNKRITAVTELFNEQGNRNKRLFDTADKQLRQSQNEIQQLKVSLKAMGQDPNMLNRY